MTKSPLNVIAIIPARGASKRVPRKNLLPLAGRPLLAHSILHAKQSKYVNEVYVSTEDPDIEQVARNYGAEVVKRPLELAGDRATSESALLHVLDDRIRHGFPDPDLVVFLQCTSPIRLSDDIDNAIQTLLNANADSLFSAVKCKEFIWEIKDRQLYSLTYDYRKRQRTQNMAVQYRENGSIFIFRPQVLRKNNNRLGGKIVVYEMDYWSAFELDIPEDADLLERILCRPDNARSLTLPESIELVVFDFDGVMTDNTITVTETGSEAVSCHRGDGWGIARLREASIPMVVISTEANPVVAARCAKLKIACYQNIGDKGTYLTNFLQEQGINPMNVIYLGNDVNDLGCLKMVGMPVAVADAHPSVIAASQWVLTHKGGKGAVRELCDRVLVHLTQKHEIQHT